MNEFCWVEFIISDSCGHDSLLSEKAQRQKKTNEHQLMLRSIYVREIEEEKLGRIHHIFFPYTSSLMSRGLYVEIIEGMNHHREGALSVNKNNEWVERTAYDLQY